jgi:hypothetical protein
MGQSSFDVEVDVTALIPLADKLARIDAAAFGAGNLTAVNQVATRSEEKFRANITGPINLSDQYVRSKMGVRLADNAAQPEAVIYALGTQTQLGRFDPTQLTQAVKHPKRSKGDPRRGIAPGQKAAGVAVEVVRGTRKPITNGFLLPLTGGGWGVFTRGKGDLKYQARLGPAVYQLARIQFDEHEEEVGIDLQLAVIGEAERVTDEAFQ